MNACFQALVTGASIVCDERFSVSRYFDRLEQTGATVTYLLGAMVPMLLAREPAPAERRHRARIALAPGVPERFHGEFLRRTGLALLEGYGSTETNFARWLAEQRLAPWAGSRPSSRPVADEHDAPVPDGQPGELLLRARLPYAIATGYFAMADKTVEAWRNLWFHTGDRVVRDADGYYRFLDRMKDAIAGAARTSLPTRWNRCCWRIRPSRPWRSTPLQSELAEDEVSGGADLQAGQQGGARGAAGFLSAAHAVLRGATLSRALDELPRTENGKIRKFKLRDEGVTADTWDRDKAGYKVSRQGGAGTTTYTRGGNDDGRQFGGTGRQRGSRAQAVHAARGGGLGGGQRHGVVRLLHLRHGGGAGVRRAVLSQGTDPLLGTMGAFAGFAVGFRRGHWAA